jgi:tRNA uridine 5-carboxymethylaminomethyl modification enzyme
LADGRELRCRAAIITTGTFLRGLMHCGESLTQGGRIGEGAAVTLSDQLTALGFRLGRLKTGTPPRVHRDSIDFAPLEPQPGDDPPVPFSFMTSAISQPQIDCWITHTNARTHEIIRENIHRAPMYSGQIQSRGPRYCPSVEDKIMRFADKETHQVFLEPEGYDDPWIYCNGISTSLPRDVQDGLVHSIAGLENAKIVQYGYAVEYDWVPTDQIDSTLQTRRVAGLYLAGQINGTSGYEEAAGQGLLAGMNAAAVLLGREPVVLGRDQAYIGVMIDDLVMRPPDEPYRMFTSRAEYRLHLRSDNADLRLTPTGRRLGVVDSQRWDAFERKREAIEAVERVLAGTRMNGQTLAEHLRRPDVHLADLCREMPEFVHRNVCADALAAVEIGAKYAGYLEREQRQIDRHRQLEARTIPESFDYAQLQKLRIEAREKFARLRPRSLGQAARISGISPADIATLSLYLLRRPVRSD